MTTVWIKMLIELRPRSPQLDEFGAHISLDMLSFSKVVCTNVGTFLRSSFRPLELSGVGPVCRKGMRGFGHDRNCIYDP
jgi:hypothetical protein